MVLPIDEVMYQARSVRGDRTERYIAADGVERGSRSSTERFGDGRSAQVARPRRGDIGKDKKDKKDNICLPLGSGDKADAERALAARREVSEDIYLPRIHVASMETCGCIADFDTAQGKLTVYNDTQAPHAVRTVLALVAGHVGLSRKDPHRVPDIAAVSAAGTVIPATLSRSRLRW